MLDDPGILAFIAFAFFTAGFVKGIGGFGLPLTSLGILVLLIDFKLALALLVVPSVLANVWQAVQGNYFWSIVRRLRVFLAIGFVVTIVSQLISQGWDTRMLTTVLGVLVMGYTGLGLITRPFFVQPHQEVWLNPVMATLSGFLSGLSGAFAVPAGLYFQALGMTKDMLVQTLGIWFLIAALGLAIGVAQNPRIDLETWAWSAAATLPVLAGMVFGQKLRRRINEAAFRRYFLTALFCLGAWLMLRGFLISG